MIRLQHHSCTAFNDSGDRVFLIDMDIFDQFQTAIKRL